MTNLLSIIIPTYNMQAYLRHCLDSLLVSDEMLNQFEVLVINDGSKDDSSKIAHEYETKYPNTFRVIDKENGNYGSCINCGLKIATGKYVKILDADDSFDTANFESFLRLLSSVDVDMIITSFAIVDESGIETSRVVYDLPMNAMLAWEQLTLAFKKKALQMHAVTYKRQNLIDIHYRQSEGISYTDQEWIFTPLITVNTAIAFAYPVYKYLVGRQGQTMTADVFRRNISHNEQCCRRIIKDYKSFSKFESVKQEYIDYRFIGTLTAMYYWCLVQYPDLDLQQLVNYDDYVQSVDASYIDLLDKQVLKYTHYRYIKQWHKNRQERIKVCSLYHWYARLMSKVYRCYVR